MATVKIKWRPSTIEGKAGTIYYRIIHNRVVRQLKTDYKVFAAEWSDAHGVFVIGYKDRSGILASIQERIAWDLKRLNTIIERFSLRSTQYTADDIIRTFISKSQEQSFFGFMQNVIAKLKLLSRYRTAENYATTLNSFMQFRENKDLLLGEITSDLMMRHEAYLISRSVTKNTSSFYIRILRSVP